ncbi:MAG: hypothetical protein RIM23_14755 [Coleofasciculus sp. G3-WIS-01]|uniref:hypothetical protein n=1 Tax=Coleofasciculus sp. G3-WIS-01 TaxID=3069528 RepID=UPI00330127EF
MKRLYIAPPAPFSLRDSLPRNLSRIKLYRLALTVLQHLDKARQHWILLDIIRVASCFTLAVSELNQSTGLKSDETRPTLVETRHGASLLNP